MAISKKNDFRPEIQQFSLRGEQAIFRDVGRFTISVQQWPVLFSQIKLFVSGGSPTIFLGFTAAASLPHQKFNFIWQLAGNSGRPARFNSVLIHSAVRSVMQMGLVRST